jgi:gamma-glutamyltranspeptidase/glutathione hydrolase
VVAEGTGVVLNDEMDDFASKPGVPNMFGVVGSDANSIAPKKRPLSSMTPTILTKDDKVAMVIGTPGGSRIFTSIFQVITNVYDFNMPLGDAVGATRFHHQLLPPNTIFQEPYHQLDADVIKQLEDKGYKFTMQGFNGDIQAIRIDGDKPEPMSDPRGRGVSRVIR